MGFEIKIIEFLQAGRNPFFDFSFQAISALGSVFGFVIVCLFFLLKNRKLFFWHLLSYGFAFLFVHILKNSVMRVRPFNATDSIVPIGDAVQDFSFPSGHVACATAIAIFLGVYLFEKHQNKTDRVWICVFLTFYVALVGLSRMYLGKHYLTDLLGGVAVSAFFCVAGLVLMHFWTKQRKKTKAGKSEN